MDIRLLEASATPPDKPWRRWLLRSIGAALLLKLVALFIIKSAFFSAARAPDVTPRLVDEQLAVGPRASSAEGSSR